MVHDERQHVLSTERSRLRALLTRRFLIGCLLAVAVTVTYANHFDNGFHFDDAHTIINNVFIRDLGNFPRFFTDARTSSSLPLNQTYRPVVTTTLAIDYAIGGRLTLWAFHMSTFALFLLQGIAMFFLFRRVLAVAFEPPTAERVAFVAVAIYLLHPANAETVNYVIARSDTLSTLGIVLSLTLYTCAPRTRKFHLYLVPAAIGILAKAVAVVLAPLLFLYELTIGEAAAPGRGKTGRGVSAARAALPALALSLALLMLIRAMTPPTWLPGNVPRYQYFITQPFVIFHYFTNFLLPLGLSADTDWKPLDSAADPRFLAGAAFLALLLLATVFAARRPRWRPVSFGLAWFLVCLVPTSFVYPLAEVLNDHRVFLPYVGLALAATASASLALERAIPPRARWGLAHRGIAVAIASLLCVAAVWTHRRNDVWHSEETLWRDVTIKSPGNGRGWMNYGLALMSKGDYVGAEEAFRRALVLVPYYSYLHVNFGVLQAATGRTEEAEQSFRRGISLSPDLPGPHFYFARFLAKQQRPAEAIPLLRTALRLAPAELDVRHLLLNLLRESGDFAQLEDLAQETLRIAPGDTVATAALKTARERAVAPAAAPLPEPSTPEEWVNLSLSEYRAKRFRESIRASEKALSLRPGYDVAYNNICAAHNELGEWDEAIAACEKAVAANPSNTLARNNLAWGRKRRAETR